MEYLSTIISLLALAFSGFTFYWLNMRDKKIFYLLRVDRVTSINNPELAFVNGGSKHILLTTIQCGFENEQGDCFYPSQKIDLGNSESLLLRPGSAIHCKTTFLDDLTNSFITSGTLLKESVPELFQHKVRIDVAWIDHRGRSFESTSYISKQAFSIDGTTRLHTPLIKKHDLVKAAQADK